MTTTSKPKTTIRMGASHFSVQSSFGGMEVSQDLYRDEKAPIREAHPSAVYSDGKTPVVLTSPGFKSASDKTLGSIARDLCKLHGITDKQSVSRKRRAAA